jgi:hypothetical protein
VNSARAEFDSVRRGPDVVDLEVHRQRTARAVALGMGVAIVEGERTE